MTPKQISIDLELKLSIFRHEVAYCDQKRSRRTYLNEPVLCLEWVLKEKNLDAYSKIRLTIKKHPQGDFEIVNRRTEWTRFPGFKNYYWKCANKPQHYVDNSMYPMLNRIMHALADKDERIGKPFFVDVIIKELKN
jgi:hypothetical protein